MQTVLSTSLSMPRFDRDAYVRSGLDYMILSIDGAAQSVYEGFRRRGKIDLVYAKIQKLVHAKRRIGTRTPIVYRQFLAFEYNRHVIVDAVDIARCLGLDAFKSAAPFDVGWDDPGIQLANVRRPRSSSTGTSTRHSPHGRIASLCYGSRARPGLESCRFPDR